MTLRRSRPTPEVMLAVPVAIANDVATTRSLAAEAMAFYGESPSYKSMIGGEGVAGPADLAIRGDETPVVAEVLRLRDCGTSEITTRVTALPLD